MGRGEDEVRAVSDAGDRIGGIISLNLENCENPLWIRCDSMRARGSAYDWQIGFRRREGRDRNRIAGDKSVRGQEGRAAETVSFAECSRRSVSWETVRSREPIYCIALCASFDLLACKLKPWT